MESIGVEGGSSLDGDGPCDALDPDTIAAAEMVEAREPSTAVSAVLPLGRSDNAEPSDPSPAVDADLLRREYDECLDTLAEICREEAALAAKKVRTVARCARVARTLAAPGLSLQEESAQEMAFVAEVACVLTVTEPAAANLLAEARELTTALPLTLSALQAGTISWQHARIMVDETSGLGPVGAQALEAHFLDPDDPTPARGCPAGEMVPGRFRAKARTWRERHHPVSIEKRHAKCALDRRVLFAPDRDGMAWLSAYLPADTAAGIWARITAAARAMQGPDEDRTLTQLRADAAATWLLGGSPGDAARNGTAGTTDTTTGSQMTRTTDTTTGSEDLTTGERAALDGGVPTPRAQVLITVPVMALLGVTEEPAMLDGYGPIPPSMVQQLIADGAESFHRVLIDPRDGAPLEIGRTSYRVTPAQRRWLRLRDGKCPFPGCGNHSLDNEADHVLAWGRGGTTGIGNLGQPCPKHHRLRHTTAWTPTQPSTDEPPHWISPTGRRYQSEYPDWDPPHLPDGQLKWKSDGPDEPREPEELRY